MSFGRQTPENSVEWWRDKADGYWHKLERVRADNKRMSDQLSTLRKKKDLAPKRRGQWDSIATRRVASDTGAPTMAAAITLTVLFKVCEDAHIRSIAGLSVDGFWRDGDITNWTTSLLVVLYAALYKFFQKF